MSTGTRVPLQQARQWATEVVEQLQPHCVKIQIAGSIRRRCRTIGDIEIVCLPKPYDESPLFASGIATVVNQWPVVKGHLPCKYTQRILPCGMTLDLFMPDPKGFGLQLAIRTGSATWSHQVLARAWTRAGFTSKEGVLHTSSGHKISTPTEEKLFEIIGLTWVDPWDREVAP